MVVGALVSLLLIVAGAALLVTAVWPRSRRRVPDSGALGILEQRFAAGDIDQEELEARRAVLRS